MTVGPSLARLISRSSSALSISAVLGLPEGRIGEELAEVLAERNGFYGFESALFLRGTGDAESQLAGWNREGLWRDHYGPFGRGLFFFGEDLFGTQFAIEGDVVTSFEPETGERTKIASSLEDWADQLFDDWNQMTGHSIARAWQILHGPLPSGKRLVARIPFVMNGSYDLDNLALIDDAAAMRARGDLAQQIHDLPDGTPVRFRLPE
jgi:hypothetical protein